MKTFFIILDGAADKETNGKKTPLEEAHTPSLNFFSENGKQGYMYPVNENIVPESDTAIESMFGYTSFLSRGQVETMGAGIKLQQGDLALRTNFATITNIKEGKIIDRRCGRTLTTKEAIILAKTINKKLKMPCKFLLKPTVQHRGVLILRGGFSDNITNIDPAYKIKGKFIFNDILQYSTPLDDEEVTIFSANITNEFVEQSYFILKNHSINKNREKNRLLPANIILTRDGGTEIKEIKKLQGKWLAIVYMPLEIGIAKLTGMDIATFSYPPLKDYDVYKNLYHGLSTAIGFAKNNIRKKIQKYDFFYIHFKETDVPGHDGKSEEKKKMIELLDKEFFSFLRELTEKEKIKIIITADHSTPCSLKSHSADAVPFLVFGEGKDNTKRFTEKESMKGEIGKIYGKNVAKFIYS